MSLLIPRIVITAIIIVVAYFALVRVWTREVDLLAIFKKPSEIIPIKEKKESPLSEMLGELIPASKPTPPNTCGTIPPPMLLLYFSGTQ